VLEVLAWRSPRRYATAGERVRAEAVRAALAEAAQLGVTGFGALTGYGRALLDELLAAARRDPDADPLGVLSAAGPVGSAAVAALDKLVPPPVDHVLVQADLTVVVPGPPAPDLAGELALTAEPESANVYRITADSIRGALDAGYLPADLHGLFARRSRTPVPQALTYLVDDVARRHGGMRVGSAGAYLRSEDESLLAELIADRRLADLQLRRLAPTVLATPFTSGRLLNTLRDNGYAPVPEDATGAAVLRRPRARRAPARRAPASPRTLLDDQRPLPPPRIAGIIEQLPPGTGQPPGRRQRWRAGTHAGDGGTATGRPGPHPRLGRLRGLARRHRGPPGPPGVDRCRLPARRGRTHRNVAHVRFTPHHGSSCGAGFLRRDGGGSPPPTVGDPRARTGTRQRLRYHRRGGCARPRCRADGPPNPTPRPGRPHPHDHSRGPNAFPLRRRSEPAGCRL